MLGVTDAFKAFLFNNQVREPLVRAYFENTVTDPTHGLKSYDLEITEFLRSFGQITRELNLEHGLFRPGTNSISLRNTKDFGDYLFSLRKRFGSDLWNEKTYHIYFGFKQFPTAISVAPGMVKYASLGLGGLATQILPTSSPAIGALGDTPVGGASADMATEEVVRLYSGDIQDATYDRVNDSVTLRSRDFYQRLVDFKICKPVKALTLQIGYLSQTDVRAIQMCLRYGTHKLITRSSGTNPSVTNRNNPSMAILCHSNVENIALYVPGTIWCVPVKNELSSSGYSAGSLKVWYWDYMARIWKSFPASHFSNGYILATASSGILHFFVEDLTNCTVDGDTWSEYLAGTGSYYIKNATSTNIDVAVCAETQSALADTNPIRIVHDLLHSSRFMAIDSVLTDLLDFFSLSFPDTEYTFDTAFNFYDQEGISINVAFDAEVSVSKVVQEICDLVGCYFYVSADKSASVRRCVRVKWDKVWNPCVDAPPNLLSFSTKDRLKNYETIVSKDEYYDAVTARAFDSSTSLSNVPDIIGAGTGNKSLSLGSERVYFYNCSVLAQGLIDRLYLKHSKPTEIAVIETDASGVITELADFIKLHDHRIDEEIVTEVFRWSFDLQNKIRISARRYTKLFGPDEKLPYKVYAFADCARAGTNTIGGSGTDASITSGDKTVTFGDTLDLGKVKKGMALRIASTIFWIDSITDSTHVEVTIAATATLTSQAWSIGNSYHAR